MKLENVDFNKIETVRVKCVDFSQDRKKAVRRWLELYPIEALTGVDENKGYYLEVRRNGSFVEYIVWSDCEGKIAVNLYHAYDGAETSELSKFLCDNAMYKGSEGYKKLLSQKEAEGKHINVVNIAAMDILGESELALHYQQYREKFLQRREQEELERKRQEELEQKRREEEQQKVLEAKLVEAEECIRGNRLVKNEKLDDGKCLILCLMKKHDVKVPLKTQGWINSKLVNVTFEESGDVSLQFYRYKGCKCSESVYQYLRLLKAAVDRAA